MQTIRLIGKLSDSTLANRFNVQISNKQTRIAAVVNTLKVVVRHLNHTSTSSVTYTRYNILYTLLRETHLTTVTITIWYHQLVTLQYSDLHCKKFSRSKGQMQDWKLTDQTTWVTSDGGGKTRRLFAKSCHFLLFGPSFSTRSFYAAPIV